MTELLMIHGLPALLVMVLVPLSGPVLQKVAERARPVLSVLDGFMLVSIAGLVLLDIIPHCVASAGWIAIPVTLIGLFLPTFLEGLRSRIGRRAHSIALLLATAGILTHSFVDGAGLVHESNLSAALILHRVPVGLAIWVLLTREQGRASAIIGLTLLNLATIAGFAVARSAMPIIDHSAFALFAALVAGSLLHVVVHLPPDELRRGDGWRLYSALGALLGVVLLGGMLGAHSGEEHRHGPGEGDPGSIVAVESEHDHSHAEADHVDHADGDATFGELFLLLARKSAPALLLAYLTAGLIFAFLPRSSPRWLGAGKGALSQSLRGMAFGLPLPICSCGVVPIYRSLVLRGVPLSAGLTLLVAAPELGFDAVFLSLELLDVKFTVARVIGAAAVAIIVGVTLGRANRARTVDLANAEQDGDEVRSTAQRLLLGMKSGFGEMIDHTGPWIVLGLAVAALADPLVDPEWVQRVPRALEVPVFALLGMPIYVCASGATPLVAVLVANGVSPGAGLALLLTGPATNITTFGVLAELHGRRLALSFGAVMAGLAIGFGFLVNAFLGPVETHVGGHDDGTAFEVISSVLLGIAFVASLLRQGPRDFIGQVLTQTAAMSPSADRRPGPGTITSRPKGVVETGRQPPLARGSITQ